MKRLLLVNNAKIWLACDFEGVCAVLKLSSTDF